MSYHRKLEDKRRLKKLADTNQYGTAYWDTKKQRYIRVYLTKTTGFNKFFKRHSNKRVRCAKNIVFGRHYKKVFDYWWNLY